MKKPMLITMLVTVCVAFGATAAFAGYKAVEIPSADDGTVDLAALDQMMDDTVAAVMLTVPNTLGVFEHRILEIAELVHERGGLIYMDGANLNAFVGRALAGKMGVDAMHINLHKTFSTPHGGGGPGAGPVAVSETLLEVGKGRMEPDDIPELFKRRTRALSSPTAPAKGLCLIKVEYPENT